MNINDNDENANENDNDNDIRIMHELPWITIFGHEWGDLPMIFTSDLTSD